MMLMVKKVLGIQDTKLYNKAHVRIPITDTELALLLSSKYTLDEFKAIIRDWSTIKLKNEISTPVFSLSVDKLSVLRDELNSRKISIPKWLRPTVD